MSLDLNELASGIKEALGALAERGVNLYALIPGAPILPFVVVVPQSDFVGYHEDVGNAHATVQVALRLYVHGDEQGMQLAYELLSAGVSVDHSIHDLIEAARPNNGGDGFGSQVSDVVALVARYSGERNMSQLPDYTPAHLFEIPLRIMLRKDTR